MTAQYLWVLLIPAAFAAVLVWMMVRQRQIDRMHREALAEIDREIARGSRRLGTMAALVQEWSAGKLSAPGKIVDIGDRSVVCEEGGERFTVLLDELKLPDWALDSPEQAKTRPR